MNTVITAITAIATIAAITAAVVITVKRRSGRDRRGAKPNV
jgi:hypothetical protein